MSPLHVTGWVKVLGESFKETAAANPARASDPRNTPSLVWGSLDRTVSSLVCSSNSFYSTHGRAKDQNGQVILAKNQLGRSFCLTRYQDYKTCFYNYYTVVYWILWPAQCNRQISVWAKWRPEINVFIYRKLTLTQLILKMNSERIQ